MNKFIFLFLFLSTTACKKNNNKIPQNSIDSTITAFPITNRNKDGVLGYLASLKSANRVIIGQQCGDGDDALVDYNNYVEALFTQSTKYAGLLGVDYGWKATNNYSLVNQLLINHWNARGLVTISWHADNPWVSGYDVRWNSVSNKNSINLNSLLKNAPSSTEKNNYRTELSTIATALVQLKNAGVVVIWRPFHEMNSDWFWWGINSYNSVPSNVTDFMNLWKDMYDTFTNDYGLDNLIWTYSPSMKESWNADIAAYYPGNNFVDLVGEDYYGTSPDFPDFPALNSLGKTTVLCEAGPSSNNYGNWDEMSLLNTLKGKAAYFLQWKSWTGAKVAIIDNKNSVIMMKNSAALTRDRL